MEFIIKVKDNVIKNRIDMYLDDTLFDYYGKDVLEECGAPSKKQLIETIFKDPAFVKKFNKRVLEQIDIWDHVYDAMDGFSIPIIDKIDKNCMQYVTRQSQQNADLEDVVRNSNKNLTGKQLDQIIEKMIADGLVVKK